VLCSEDGVPRGSTWEYDASLELAFAKRAITTSRRIIANSVRIVAGGGVAVALGKESISSGFGMEVDISEDGATEMLFSEGGPRALYFVSAENAEKFVSLWDGFPITAIGRVRGDSLLIGDFINIETRELVSVFNRGGLLRLDAKE
jgi:phosphoribosylformylglycinamidine (FGAM) synthase-like enzyme